jgi:hypothetical protein
MAFIRKKRGSGGATTYQVVRSERQGGKVRQQVLCCLMYAPTITEAIEAARDFMAEALRRNDYVWLRRWSAREQKLRQVQAETGLP